MDEFVAALLSKGAVDAGAAKRIAELEAREHLPLAREINTALYAGALLILAGVGASVKDKLDQLGPVTIAAALAAAAGACYSYCFLKGRPLAAGKVESPTAAFDYILYLGCGLTGIFFSYLEWKWKLLGSWWDLYLFGSGLAFIALAYRFDNRLTLAAGLMNLAAFLGLRAGLFNFGTVWVRLAVTAYGVALFAAGAATRKGELKPHFADTYISLGVHLALAAMLSDAWTFDAPQFWTLLVACAALGAWSLRERRFDTFAAAVGYEYISVLAALLHGIHGSDATLWIIVLSAGMVLAVLLRARSVFREAAS